VSSRWSYGPEGLREVPIPRRSGAELLPRWRDLQPILIRSAGVVGIVATVMGVVSSNAFRFEEGAQPPGRNDPPVDLAAATDGGAVIVAPPTESVSPPDPALSAATPAVSAAPAVSPTPAASAAESMPQAAAEASPTPVALATVDAMEAGRADPSVAPAADATGAQSAPANEASSAQPSSADPATSTHETAADPAAGAPSRVVAAAATSSEAPPPTTGASAVATLATVEPGRPADMSLADVPAGDPSDDAADGAPSPWVDEAANCLRDWVAADGTKSSAGHAPDCTATEKLIASVSSDQADLKDAATAHAEDFAATLPRIPLPRPDIVPDIKPDKPAKPARATRVSRASSDWPSAPPPNCAAGKHAKWRFTNRQTGAKEWYCR